MVSEGVDIPRLRVLVYLPNALTELAFRQGIGRVVRSAGEDDDTRAYVVMPSFETFNLYAKRVEKEMPDSYRNAREEKPKTKSERGPVHKGVKHESILIIPRLKHTKTVLINCNNSL